MAIITLLQKLKRSFLPPKPLKVGLILPGGGAKCIGYLGAFKAFEEEGVPIDIIVGYSGGALVGGLYAYFGSVEKLIRIAQETPIRRFLHKNPLQIIQEGEVLDDREVIQFLNDLTQGVTIEALPKEFIAVATDLGTGQPVFLKEGNLARAIVASCAAAGVFEPQKLEGKLLIDGGFSEPHPTQEVRKWGADLVVTFKTERIGWSQGAGLIENLWREYLIFESRYVEMKQNLYPADFIISGEFWKLSPVKFGDVKKGVEIGYQAAKEILPQLKRSLGKRYSTS